jgi:hypothetical protein
MTTEGTTAVEGASNAAVEKPLKAAAKRKRKAAKPKGKGKKSVQADKARQKRSVSDRKGSGDAKTTPYRAGSC